MESSSLAQKKGYSYKHSHLPFIIVTIFASTGLLIGEPVFTLLVWSFLLFPIALIKPNLALPFIKNINRKKALAILGALFIISIFLVPESEPIQIDSQLPQKQQVEQSTKVLDPTQKQISPAPTELDIRTSSNVISIIDGDTIIVDGKQRVRYIGIDSPETNECLESEATEKNRSLVEGKQLRLEKDVSETDRYGRLLRYIWVGNTFVNEELVKTGYAQASAYPPDTKYQSRLNAAENYAKSNNLGIWNKSLCNSNAQSTDTAPTSVPAANQQNTGSCQYSCNGPDRDCSDFSTHAEAQTFFNCCGFTAHNDPMRLDSIKVGDGIACESLP